jgi:hypothetical protein
MTAARKEFFNSFMIALLFGSCFYAVVFCLQQRGMIMQVPNSDYFGSILDSGWYRSVAEKGYEFKKEPSNTAFYMLFPLMWKWSHMSAYGVSALNILLLAAGFGLFCTIYSFTTVEKLVLLSVPSMYLCFVPYSEALSIFSISLGIWGWVKNKRYIMWLGLFMAAMTRPPNTVLIIAFLITEIICNDRKAILRSVKDYFVNYGFPLMAGLALFIYYQYSQTGVWFAFFKQEENWGHVFAWPTFPLNSMYGWRNLWLDAVAMFLGFVSLIFLIRYGLLWLVKNKFQSDKVLTVSFLFFTAMLFETMLFNPTWGVTPATNVYDVHRYVFISPFFWVFVHRFTKNGAYKPLDYLLIFVLANVFWLIFRSYHHIQDFVYFNFGTAMILLYMVFADKKLSWPALVIFGLQLFLMLSMFNSFLKWEYPG